MAQGLQARMSHQSRIEGALKLVERIRENLQARFDEAESPLIGINWGHVGDVAKAEADLDDLLAFLTSKGA